MMIRRYQEDFFRELIQVGYASLSTHESPKPSPLSDPRDSRRFWDVPPPVSN